MSYYHHLIKKFDGCPVSVAITDDADWRAAIVAPIKRVSSLTTAAEYILDKGSSLRFVVVTAHTAEGDVDINPDDVENLVAVVQLIRDCQD
ncbi:hypothetical protein [Paracoccus litorisediminis]|uniref:Uncharacterized protein n=1 Tax=Paracoccus litorisediminis TaxID=2006130 RepID=A0A844HQS2_9RHOB|nr:hypothetical protein [Paracoccus litorisediminis]MTH62196.1 hypothetical protein [Paracoccus litorisediminis]